MEAQTKACHHQALHKLYCQTVSAHDNLATTTPPVRHVWRMCAHMHVFTHVCVMVFYDCISDLLDRAFSGSTVPLRLSTLVAYCLSPPSVLHAVSGDPPSMPHVLSIAPASALCFVADESRDTRLTKFILSEAWYFLDLLVVHLIQT